ncbi:MULTISPECIES: hypothetical protein [Aneurinibacillus]|jgi:hypothetical protein|uniref:Uncharacterized protein n=1 Tax=Aneurinibacillus danicus TaxID=267746 RepID=A0A511V7F8_9BACL|nr:MULTISPECIES: hypothetical protein [Aneurinibacillus]GEN33112.1 hypothetical protein ADA01nite_05720 [Aneurinibacillus danicus]
MDKAKKKTKHKWMLIPAGFLLWSVIYTLLVLYKQRDPGFNANNWNEHKMQVNLPAASPLSSPAK